MPEPLTALINHPDFSRWMFVLLSGGAAAIFGVVLVQLGFEWLAPSRQRMKQLAHTGPNSPKKHSPLQRWIRRLALSISQALTPKKGKEVQKIRNQLAFIGYDHTNSIKLFFGSKFLLGGLAAGLVYVASAYFPDYTRSQVLIGCGAGGFIGMLIPNKILEVLVEKRLEVYRKGFPDSLDLLLVCVEAGLGLNAAILRVSKELAISHPLLSEQYAIVNEETRVGIDRVKALKNFAERTRLEDAENLVSLLSQSMKYGTSVSETLRVFASELRDKRMQRAEEKAAMVGTKLIFPLVVCIFPSFFLVIIGPAVLGIMRSLG